ncbi:hypothetical protein FKM82_025716 [Ascaphus truei]
MVLDYILASKGGVYALIKEQCCVFIQDQSGKVQHELDKIGEIQERLRKEGDTDWDLLGLTGLVRSLGAKFLNVYDCDTRCLLCLCYVCQRHDPQICNPLCRYDAIVC